MEYNNFTSLIRGMHVSPAKHSYGSDRRTDRQTDGQTDDRQSDPYVSLCFAGDTKITLSGEGSSQKGNEQNQHYLKTQSLLL